VAANSYDGSPNQLDVYVDPNEAEAIASGDPKVFAKNPALFSHYAARVARTIKHMRNQVTSLHRDMQSLQVNRSAAGAPATLSPLEAVRYLTPEQFAQVADDITRSRITAALDAERLSRETYSEAISRINEAKLVLGSLAGDTHLSDDARARVSKALTRFTVSEAALSDLGAIFDSPPALPPVG
jgi:hypothetical protein